MAMIRRVLLAAAVLGCAPAVPPAASTPAPGPVRSAYRRADAASSRWADSVLNTLSLRDKAAQLVWPWILGDYVPEGSAEWRRITRLIAEDKVGGIIVSVGSPVEIATKVNAMQRLSALPLIVSADLETGVGFRARGGYYVPNAIDLGGATNFPQQMALGAANDPQLAYELGRVTAREGRALGIHIAYNPVLDVNNNPANPVIGARSISEDPGITGRMGAAVIRGLQENGMLATGKHFPGHGDTEVNSHLALASVTAGRARLDSVELAPFRAAIEAGVGAIMTFHGFFPALDREQVPATLSPRVMTDLLRRELKFDGLLVTDAMTMRGVVDTYGDVEAAKRAIAAGNDVLLMPTDTRQAIEAVVAGVRESRYDEARLNASVKRVLQLKHQFELHRERLVPVEAVRRVVGDSAHEAAAQRLADQSFVLVRDSGAAIPIVRSGSRPRVLSLTYARRTDLSAGGVFADELARRTGPVRSMYVNADELAPNVSHVIAAATQQDVIVVSSYVNITSETATADAPQPLNDLMRQLVATGKPVVLITFGTPYLLRQLPFVPTYAIAWGSTGASQRAAARAITGEMAVRGRLPISIPPLIPVGAGLQRSSR